MSARITFAMEYEWGEMTIEADSAEEAVDALFSIDDLIGKRLRERKKDSLGGVSTSDAVDGLLNSLRRPRPPKRKE